MRKPSSGWPKYKDRKHSPDKVDLGKLASVFVVCGILSLLTSFHFNQNTRTETFALSNLQSFESPLEPGGIEDMSMRPGRLIGPIRAKKRGEVYTINVYASMPVQSWSFIEGEVLDQDKEYLFSFGKELWHETGRDAEGTWREQKNNYDMKVTFPQRGVYYLNFKTDSNKDPFNVKVTIRKKKGSSLPHLWFGLLTLITGLILNEKKNKTITRMAENLGD